MNKNTLEGIRRTITATLEVIVGASIVKVFMLLAKALLATMGNIINVNIYDIVGVYTLTMFVSIVTAYKIMYVAFKEELK